MLRYEDINDISDGRLYRAEDKALLGTNGCKGCSHCCRSDMGASIVLTPYDIYRLTLGTGKSFDELLVNMLVEISLIDGIALPHLKMDGGCGFLVDERCSIHEYRPGICRLFPLGRLYKDKGFDYILQTGQCIRESRTPVVISDWLGEEDLPKNEAFINKWHGFLEFEKKKINEIREFTAVEAERIKGLADKELLEYASIVGDDIEPSEEKLQSYRKEKPEELYEEAEDRVKDLMKIVLSELYMQSYDQSGDKDFYEQFNEKLKSVIRMIRTV